ncbi:hypothetical protein HDG36_001768 [Paraburkholderia sp. Kb1A]|uniref:phage portal protein family protein n=2 Tax=unclassified Paraburkholderia TaxID=2615204 RepID=UPI0017ACA412|nr:hypothetical protein [Paraburkholderia sp. HC6.4b]MBB5450232.1 hypothetical protein [Paraburkholderia sp. Kb1A]
MIYNDETIGGVLFAIRTLFRTVDWRVEPAMSDKEKKYSAWLDNALFTEMGSGYIEKSWTDFVQNVLTCVEWGWSYFDAVLKKLNDGSIGIDQFMLIAQDSLMRWEMEPNNSGRVLGLHQLVPSAGTFYIPLDRALHFVVAPNRGNPEGMSCLRTSYRPFFYKRKLVEIESILAERGTGFPVIYVPASLKTDSLKVDDKGMPTEDARNAAALCKSYEDLAKNIRMNSQSGAVIYADFVKNIGKDGEVTNTNNRAVELKLTSPGQTNAVDVDRAIKRHDSGMARALLADFLFFGSQGTGGNKSLGEDRSQLFMRAISGWLTMIKATVNTQIVSRLWELNNFPPQMKPMLEPGDVTKESIAALAADVASLANAGVIGGPDVELDNEIRTSMGLPKRKDGLSDDDLPALPTDAPQ